MKEIVFIISVLILSLDSKSQYVKQDTINNYILFRLPEYYKQNGVIFYKTYPIGIDLKNMAERYSPNIEDVKLAEEIFNKRYNDFIDKGIDVKTYFANYVRQYIGYIDKNGKKNIIIQLIDNSRPRKVKKMFSKDWQTHFVSRLSDDFYAISRIFRVNLEANEISTVL